LSAGAPHPLDEAIALQPLGPDRWQGRTSPAYANMVGPFGGVTAAVLLQAVLQHPARQGDPIALTVNFAGPVADGGFEVVTEAARTNRSTQHWQLRMVQGAETVATGSAVLATRRPTWSALEANFPAVADAPSLDRAPPIGRVRWTSAYDMRFAKGPMPRFGEPSASQGDSESLLWMRDEPPRPLDFASLAALCDAFFPRIFVRRPTQWVPIGTVTFGAHFHADATVIAHIGSAHVLGHARAHQFRNGFFDQSAQLWGAGGELLATTHQLVYYKA
jgi:hypothetical protein